MSRYRRARIAGLLQAAKRGDRRAQSFLGNIYLIGNGVPIDTGKAFRWYRQAARRGDAQAQYMLGLLETRRGPEEIVPGRAAHWLRKAAKQGHVGAAAFLGILCFEHPSVALCETEPCRWLHVGAEHGDIEACYFLGRLYEHGHGVQACERLAFSWYRQAAEARHEDAAYRFAFAYSEAGVEDYDLGQMRAWLGVAADGEHDDARYFLGLMCLHGEGGPRDTRRATDLFFAAAYSGHIEAFAGLAHIYSGGEVDAGEPVDALEWLRLDAPRGDPLVHALQGLPYLWGICVDADPVRAFTWFVRASTTTDPVLRVRLGDAFLIGSYSAHERNHAYALALLADSLVGGESTSSRLAALARTVTPVEAAQAHALLWPLFPGATH